MTEASWLLRAPCGVQGGDWGCLRRWIEETSTAQIFAMFFVGEFWRGADRVIETVGFHGW